MGGVGANHDYQFFDQEYQAGWRHYMPLQCVRNQLMADKSATEAAVRVCDQI